MSDKHRLLRTFLVTALGIVALTGNVKADASQAQVFLAGVNLGQVEARLHFLSRSYGNRPVPQSQLTQISIDLRNAAAHVSSAERLFRGIRSPNRASQTRNILNKINRYTSATRGYSYRNKINYIRGIRGNYQSLLSVTYVSSRLDSFQARPTCDTKFLFVGYHFGRAHVASTTYPTNAAWRRRVGAGSYQSQAYSAMTGVIGDGLRLAVDGYAPGRASDNVYKVCCSFGSPTQWGTFRRLVRANSSAAQFAYARNYQVRVIQNTALRPGACGGNSSNNRWLHGRWYFGRVGARQHLCILNLTSRRGRYGNVISNSCHPNESFWSVNRGSIEFKDRSGRLTTRFTRRNNNYLQGPYIPNRSIPTRGIVHYLSRRPVSGQRTSTCQWRGATVLGQRVPGCECWCGGNKADARRCGRRPADNCRNR